MHGIFGLTMLVLILKAIPLTRNIRTFAKAEFVYCIYVSIDLSLYLQFKSDWAKKGVPLARSSNLQISFKFMPCREVAKLRRKICDFGKETRPVLYQF